METRSAEFYDLLKHGLGEETTYQEFVDKIMALKYNGPDTPGFTWDDEIQIDFDYAQIQAELGMYTMATYVDIDSPGVYKKVDGFELSTGKIPRRKHGFALNEKILREQMIFLKRTEKFSSNFQDAMRRLLFNSTDKLIGGNYNNFIDQRDQMVSKGEFTISVDNNPAGITGLTFYAKIPKDNRIILKDANKWFTGENRQMNPNATVIKDVLQLIRLAKNAELKDYHIEMSSVLYDEFINFPDVRSSAALAAFPLLGKDNALEYGLNMDDEAIERYLNRKLAPIVVRDTICAVEKYDKEQRLVGVKQTRPFADNQVVLVPNGSLGTIKSVEPIVVSDPGMRVAYFDGGRTVLKQWFIGRTNTQYIESECTALVVPDKPQYMFYLTVA